MSELKGIAKEEQNKYETEPLFLHIMSLKYYNDFFTNKCSLDQPFINLRWSAIKVEAFLTASKCCVKLVFLQGFHNILKTAKD